MQTPAELTVEVSLQPSDVYDPFLWCPQNMWRWALAITCFLLVCTAPPSWSSSLTFVTPQSTPVALFVVGAVGFVGWLAFPYVRVRWMFSRNAILRQPRRIFVSANGVRFESPDVCADCK